MFSRPDIASLFTQAIADHLEGVRPSASQQNVLEQIAVAMTASLNAGGKILRCGNGGSAADAQHLAAELVGRFRRELRGLPSISLTTDTSMLTAVANDYRYNAVFARQIEALGAKADIFVGISTSGDSRNVTAALEVARALGMTTVAFTGAGGGRIGTLAHHLFAVPSRDTARVQEMHILFGHMLYDWIELHAIHTRSCSGLQAEQSSIE